MNKLGRKLYLTYTKDDLTKYGSLAVAVARECGWTVFDGPTISAVDPDPTRLDPAQCDALLLLSAQTYGYDEVGQAPQEREWDSARRAGKPARALLFNDESEAWPLKWIEFLRMPQRKGPLQLFHSKLLNSQRWAPLPPDEIQFKATMRDQLSILTSEVEETTRVRVFVVWDFGITGFSLILDSLMRRPPDGIQIDTTWPDKPGTGEILRDNVLKGIAESNRVLVVTDRPNANVAFEAGLALGLEKSVSLVHFGEDIPRWLKESLFKGFVTNAVRDVEGLRDIVLDEKNWRPTPAPPELPGHGSTLFLTPAKYVGAALREEQRHLFHHWKLPPSGFNLNDVNRTYGEVAHVVWAITPFSDGSDSQDGAENAANGVTAGWFCARVSAKYGAKHALDRLTVLRHKMTREVADVQVSEKLFGSITEFTKFLKDVKDRRLPEVLAAERREFGNVGYRMVKVPSIVRGDKTLWAGITPVTNAQFRLFCDTSSHAKPWSAETSLDFDELPVVNVSLHDAEQFCGWAGFELPTSELWLRLFHAGTTGTYWWGDDPSTLPEVAWYKENSLGQIHPVGKKAENCWGLRDLVGNVWEWTKGFKDTLEVPYKDEIIEVIRAEALGGAFNSAESQLLVHRVLSPHDHDQFTGFRCVAYF